MSMQAVIFASGAGTRMFPVTLSIPKCLIDVNGKTLLHRIIDNLLEHSVVDIIITTGPHEKQIKKFINKTYPDLVVRFVKNKLYAETNYIYSLWRARKYIRSDVLTFHSDLIYEPSLLKHVVESGKSCVLVNKDIPLPKKDFKARVKDGRVVEVGVDVFGRDAGFCMPIYKFVKKDWKIFMDAVNSFIKKGDVEAYAETAMNTVANQLNLAPIFYSKEPAMEIDTPEDWNLAKRIFPR